MNQGLIVLWVDADSCPKNLRAILVKAIIRLGLRAAFVADRELPDIKDAIAAHTGMLRKQVRNTIDDISLASVKSTLMMITVASGEDSADSYIIENCTAGTLAVTRDVPLAAKLVEKGVVVIDDRGGAFTAETIRERLSLRNAMTELRQSGIQAEYHKPQHPRDVQAFSNCLDAELVKLVRRFPGEQPALNPRALAEI